MIKMCAPDIPSEHYVANKIGQYTQPTNTRHYGDRVIRSTKNAIRTTFLYVENYFLRCTWKSSLIHYDGNY